MEALALPFSVKVLADGASDGTQSVKHDFRSLLPAATRTKKDHIIVPQADIEFLEGELLVTRLNNIQKWLWLCGRPMPPRPLHRQVVLSRNITVSEEIELHLVWHKYRIFIKPLPPYPLDPDFWASHLLASGTKSDGRSKQVADDFHIAKDNGLLPEAVSWEGWKTLSAQFLQHYSYTSENPRHCYGELRLSWLNKVYRFTQGSMLRGYSQVAAHKFYIDLIKDNFRVLAAVLGYVAIVLTSTQVGLATEELQANKAFQRASYGFTVFSIVAPLIVAVGILLMVLVPFFVNWRATKIYERLRFREMGVL
ncbi:uncharacterized protein BCR38DRAFT_467415 [Pseudomassariella vexata]|uniref:Subtilisin-like serine protease n=1 Tax=Pseudomassariella vexata TaxID=1141098 RepID=A0A1Y2DQ83_9PEZI|nr:uncharacterized protein BCR38DRAFT_467415 [Pseudomassariella vexata]ORY61453.1 hypothetical protein BCR38DRAFT_467415 [Pseudomassariella vexata]